VAEDMVPFVDMRRPDGVVETKIIKITIEFIKHAVLKDFLDRVTWRTERMD
jgi:hypothetical protein